MTREQLQALVKALEPIGIPSREDAFRRALSIIDGKATFDEAFGVGWGEGATWNGGNWGEVRRLGTADGKKLGDGRKLGVP